MKNKNKTLLSILFTVILFITSFPVFAQYDDNITSKELAVFAFFRALKAAPDYNFWIGSNPEFEFLSSDQQQNYLLKETLRLGRGFSSFDYDKDVLEIKVNVFAKYIPATDGDVPRIKFSFFNHSEEYTPSFNYPYGKDVLSLVINRLAIFSDLPLNEAQNTAILKKIPYKNDDFQATLIVHVKVTKVNYDNPIKVKPAKQWFMLGEVAYLRCDIQLYSSSKDTKLWDYVAPWYEEIYRIKNMPEEEKYPHPFDLYKD